MCYPSWSKHVLSLVVKGLGPVLRGLGPVFRADAKAEGQEVVTFQEHRGDRTVRVSGLVFGLWGRLEEGGEGYAAAHRPHGQQREHVSAAPLDVVEVPIGGGPDGVRGPAPEPGHGPSVGVDSTKPE